MKENKKKEKGILDTVREVNEKEKQAVRDKKAKLAKEYEIEREEYAKSIQEDKLELLKLKSGVITESEKLKSNEEEKHYTKWQKFKNFIYHSKWWLGIATFFAAVAIFLVVDTLTQTKPDLNVMLLSDDVELYSRYDQMTQWFQNISGDINKDGKEFVNVMYIPVSDNKESNENNEIYYYDTTLTKLSAQFQLGQSMMIIGDENCKELIEAEESLVNLEELFPDCPYIDGYRLCLSETGFAEKIGYNGELPEDIYIGLRKVTDTLMSDKDTKENYDKAYDVLKKVIEDLS